MKCIIIEDETKSREALQIMLREYFPEVKVLGAADSANEGIRLIEAYSPDVVFLDIEMKGGSGFKVVDAFPKPSFKVIFTTAYSEYAIKAIKKSALDYLLKPINIEELEEAIQKCNLQINTGNKLNPSEKLRQIALPVKNGYIVVLIKDIVYCSAQRNYSYFFLANGEKMLVSKSLKEFEDLLHFSGFFRIHNSYLINLKYVKRYVNGKKSKVILANNISLEIAVRRKEAFLQSIGGRLHNPI
jgi:two-component system LytT family response regulator